MATRGNKLQNFSTSGPLTSKGTRLCLRKRTFEYAQGIFIEKMEKSHTMSKNHQGALQGDFATYILLQNIKKREGETLKKFQKKVSQCRKNEEGDPSVSSGFVCYGKKRNNHYSDIIW